jgi:hypothetical protein
MTRFMNSTAGVAGERPDPGEGLPGPARAKLTALRDRLEDARSLTQAASDKVSEAREIWQHAVRQLGIANGAAGHPLAEDHPARKLAQDRIDKARLTLDRLAAATDERAAKAAPIAHLVQAIDRYLRDLPEVKPIKAAPVQLKGKESLADAVERLRTERAKLAAQLHTVKSAPIPSADSKRKARAAIDDLAKRGTPDIRALIEWGGPITWPLVDKRAQLSGFVQAEGEPALYGQAIGEAVDVPALLAWTLKPALTAALDAEVDRHSDDAAALTDAERAKRTAALLAQILECEHQECWLIEQSEGRLEYRPDCDPRAVLSIDGPAPKAEF